ncbi:1441_t:CDS:2, partial [Racocetra fulgida]
MRVTLENVKHVEIHGMNLASKNIVSAQISKESSREYSKSSDKSDWRSNQPSWRAASFSSHDRPKQMRSISSGDTRNNFDNSSEKPWRPCTLKEINDDGR